MTQEDFVVSDGRKVAFECSGDPDGMPIFLLHGTPGCRSGPRPRASVLYRLGVWLITYDRPGYGESERDSGRSVASAAHDVNCIADKLGIDDFGVVGRSGGGPHALACAAILGSQVASTAVLVSLAPSNAEDLDWYSGMAESNVAEYSLAEYGLTHDGGQAVMDDLTQRAKGIRDDPASLLRALEPELTGPDRKIVDNVAMRRQLAEAYAEAVRMGAYGWIDDVIAFRRDWGFELSDIKGPVLLWHGAEDVFSPVAHTHWIASRLTNTRPVIKVEPGAAHFDAVQVLPKILAWMKGTRGSEGLRVKRADEAAFSL